MIEQTPIIPRTTLLARAAAVRQRTGAYGGYFLRSVGSVMIPNNPLHMWVASRNWSTRMTCLLKKSDKLDTFHYFSAANQNFVEILVATCSSHQCGPKMPLNLYILASGKI